MTRRPRRHVQIEWDATDERATYDDPAKLFRATGGLATTSLSASAEEPSTSVQWTSDAIETSNAAFGFIGMAINGRHMTLLQRATG
jgi:hypothetical protein